MRERITNELDELRSMGYEIEAQEQGNEVFVIIKGYELPNHYNRSHTDILFRIPQSYPNGKLDMFWVDPQLTLENGQIPERANVNQDWLGKTWRRYSWHPQKWNPGYDNILTFFEFIETRLAMEK